MSDRDAKQVAQLKTILGTLETKLKGEKDKDAKAKLQTMIDNTKEKIRKLGGGGDEPTKPTKKEKGSSNDDPKPKKGADAPKKEKKEKVSAPPPAPDDDDDDAPPPPAPSEVSKSKAKDKAKEKDTKSSKPKKTEEPKAESKKKPSKKKAATADDDDDDAMSPPSHSTDTSPASRREDPSSEITWAIVTEFKLEGVQIQPCFMCREQITAKHNSIKVMGNIWHKKCLKCHQCKQKITSTKFPKFQGEKYCSKKCVEAAEQSIDKDKLCAECGRLLTMQSIDIGGIKLHPLCFKCNKCKKKLKGDYVDLKGKIYCSNSCASSS